MNKNHNFLFFIILFAGWIFSSNSQTTLTHNICKDVIKTMNHSCSYSTIYFGRAFNLDDFGVTGTEEFTITHGEVGLNYVEGGASIQFNIYAIDNDFPNSFDESNLIGQSQVYNLPYIWSQGTRIAQIFTIAFENPVVVPANIDRILVEVKKGLVTGGSGLIHVAGTLQDNDDSYYKGCIAGPNYISTENLSYSPLYPPPNYNFYITAIEDFTNIDIPFRAYSINECEGLNKSFKMTSPRIIKNIVWDFGDPASGTNNTSTELNPSHIFSSPGEYTVTTSVTNYGNQTFVTTKTFTAEEYNETPEIEDIHACEDTLGSGISSSFDTSNVESQVLNGQTGVTVSYYDQSGNELPSPLPNPFTNTEPNSQEITARVSDSSNLCCFTETSFSLIVDTLPNITQIDNIFSCDNDENGFAMFDLTEVPVELINNQPNLTVELFDSSDNLISAADYDSFTNITANQDYIKAIVTDISTSCSSEININLIMDDNPELNQLPIIYGCDDNNDGVSEYFDTSNIESQVLNDQTGMTISYFDQNGNELPSPLPNPFTNSNPFNELITVRLTNNNSTCYSETTLELQTVTQPNINQPDNLYACDPGNGYAEFDTSAIEQQIIGNQAGLEIQYYDSDNNPLPSPLPTFFQNTEPYSQTIRARVEDASNPVCYSETSFDLITNEFLETSLEEEYLICDLEPSILLTVNTSFNSYQWLFEDGTLVSETNTAEIAEEGNYILTLTQSENGIVCENSFNFKLTRSDLPQIQQINHGELGDNFIEIIASGDGEFEYSIDGINFQDSNYFSNIQGGIYPVFVRDKQGCGEDSKEVNIIDYPRFFTPNNDGMNDFWQIRGISEFPDSQISIFDRYGKLLTQLTPNDLGWDGFYNGRKMTTDDYWFRADLGNGQSFSGHFTLKR